MVTLAVGLTIEPEPPVSVHSPVCVPVGASPVIVMPSAVQYSPPPSTEGGVTLLLEIITSSLAVQVP